MFINFLKRVYSNKNFCKESSSFNFTEIKLRDIQIMPMDDKTTVTNEIREIIYSVFENYKLLEKFKQYKKYFIYVSNQVLTGKTIAEAYKFWVDITQLDVFEFLPNQNFNSLCNSGLLLVRFECINKLTLNMGSYWGFKGYVLNLLIDTKSLTIWDARGEDAS